MQRKLVLTSDGSHTLYVEGLNEHYHSTHGAVQESIHVYIKDGFGQLYNRNSVDIFEMGFGTGLNALLTALLPFEGTISYTCLEAYPLTKEEIASLNYTDILTSPEAKTLFEQIHDAPWDDPVYIRPNFILTKFKGKLKNQQFEDHSFDLIYYDAFAPSVQPELWSEDIFKKISRWMRNNAVLVTYCAKGEVKRILARQGLTVETLPGPPGKNQITRATKPGTGVEYMHPAKEALGTLLNLFFPIPFKL